MKVTISIDIPDLHKRLITARLAKDLTQEDVASLSGLSIQTIQSVEQGRRGLSESSLNKLCEIYEVNKIYFLEGVDILN